MPFGSEQWRLRNELWLEFNKMLNIERFPYIHHPKVLCLNSGITDIGNDKLQFNDTLWQDVWFEYGQAENVRFTFDGSINTNQQLSSTLERKFRYERVLFEGYIHIGSKLAFLGDEYINELKKYPSDHFGLFCDIEINFNKKIYTKGKYHLGKNRLIEKYRQKFQEKQQLNQKNKKKEEYNSYSSSGSYDTESDYSTSYDTDSEYSSSYADDYDSSQTNDSFSYSSEYE